MTAPGSDRRGERKFAVALFADLSGYTALCERLDPEDVELTVKPLMDALIAAAIDEGAIVPTVAGDGFFAIFGVPSTLADAPQRAIRTAERLCELVEERNRQTGVAAVPDVHIGVAAGEVLVTPPGEHQGWSVIGSAVNLASRLCDAAGAAEVLVDDETHRLVGDSARWRGSRLLRVQGRDQDVLAWELAGEAPATAQPRSEPGFVGRSAMLAQLGEAFGAVKRLRRGQTIVISGEPGIGKTRLATTWLEEQSDTRRITVRCGVMGSATPIRQLLDGVGTYDGATGGDPAAASTAATPTATYRDDPFPRLLAETRRRLQQAASEPLIVLVDDLHLADSSVTDIVADLRQHPLPAPVLLIATARSGELDLAADILLGPLDDAEIQQLLAAVLGGPAPPEVQAVIQSRVGGHPLMAAQSASYLLESQALAVKDGVVTVVVPEALERLPASLRLSVAARIDQLPAREKAVVQELSTLGDVFDDGWVSNVLGSRSVAMLEPIAARGLIDRSGNSWRFAHGVIQEVAYSSLTRRTRGELHRRQLALLPAEALLELRGYHAVAWAESVAEVNRDELAAAVDAALAETLRLAKVRYTTEARGTHSAIKRIRPLIDDRLAANTTAVELLLLDAQCLIELGEFDEALQVTRRVEGVGREVIGPQLWLRLALTKGHALSRLRRFQSARQVLDDAVGVAESQADLSARAQAVLLMAETWRHSVFRRYISLTEDAYHLFVQAGDTAGAGECARILAYLFSPGAPVAYDRWSRAARDATADHDIRGQAWIARSNAIAYEARREFASSLAEARRAVELGELTGAADIVADGLNVSVDCHYALAEPVAAVAPAERLIEMAESQANPRMRLIAAAAASGALLRAGEIDRALEELQLAIDRVGNFGPAEEYTVAVARAVIARDRGEWESSYQAFLETDRAVQASGSVLFQLVARAEVARSGLMCDENKWADSLDGAIADSRELGTGLITSYLEAVADLARVLAGEQVELSSATAGATTEELAIRSDTAALRTELVGGDARGLWAESAALWRPVGYTVWLARAAARAGDRTAAEAVLDLLRVSPEARDWALGR